MSALVLATLVLLAVVVFAALGRTPVFAAFERFSSGGSGGCGEPAEAPRPRLDKPSGGVSHDKYLGIRDSLVSMDVAGVPSMGAHGLYGAGSTQADGAPAAFSGTTSPAPAMSAAAGAPATTGPAPTSTGGSLAAAR